MLGRDCDRRRGSSSNAHGKQHRNYSYNPRASAAAKPAASSPRACAHCGAAETAGGTKRRPEAVLAVQDRGVLRRGEQGCALEDGRAQGGVQRHLRKFFFH